MDSRGLRSQLLAFNPRGIDGCYCFHNRPNDQEEGSFTKMRRDEEKELWVDTTQNRHKREQNGKLE